MSDVVRYEWSELQAIAEQLSRSNMVPAGYRGQPQNIVLMALTGQELGWGITTAMRFVQVVEGKPTVSPEGMLALVRRAGHSVAGHSDDLEAEVHGRRSDTNDEMLVRFTIDDARRAGLAGKSNWKQYPAAMLWARAVSKLCRQLFSDVLLGAAYVPEEIDNDLVADPHPNAIDVAAADPIKELWARVVAVAGTPTAAALKALAADHGTKLTEAAVAADPELAYELSMLLAHHRDADELDRIARTDAAIDLQHSLEVARHD